MTWANWTTYANAVVSWVLGLFPQLLSVIMENPVLGVPVILVIVSLVFRLVLQFAGAFGSNKKES